VGERASGRKGADGRVCGASLSLSLSPSLPLSPAALRPWWLTVATSRYSADPPLQSGASSPSTGRRSRSPASKDTFFPIFAAAPLYSNRMRCSTSTSGVWCRHVVFLAVVAVLLPSALYSTSSDSSACRIAASTLPMRSSTNGRCTYVNGWIVADGFDPCAATTDFMLPEKMA
jgi:hypothetical protein